MKLRTFLLVIVSVGLLPLLLVSGIAIWWAHQDERRNMEQALLHNARSLTVAVDHEVETSLAGLRALASSTDLDGPDLGPFYERARLTREAYRRWLTVALVDPAGRQAANLLHPLGSALPSLAGMEVLQRTVRTGQSQVSDLVAGPAPGRWSVAVTLPVLREGKVRHILIAIMAAESFAAVLAAANMAGGTVGTIVDGEGVVVATTHGPAQAVGKPASEAFVARAREHSEAVFTDPAQPGGAAYTAFSRAPRSQFTVAVAARSEQLVAPLRRSLWLLAGAAVVAFTISLGLALLAGRTFASRMRQLGAAFDAFGRGETVPDLPAFILTELSRVGGALRDAMALLQSRTAALSESEERYRALFERNPAGMSLSLADGRIVACNEAFARMLGFASPADALTVNATALYVEPKQREQLLERIQADGAAVNVEAQLRRRDGRVIWVLASVIRSRPRGDFEATVIDITEQKTADELRTIARLANAAAHEINNPLTMVLGRLAMLREDPTLSPEIRERIIQIHAAAERIRTIVVDMNHITRVQPFEHSGSGLPEMIDIKRSARPTP
jgi:two-component system, sensor histidine kinase